ncbi:hypothetical protein RB594_005234 [Gaeumannomyces avenae]
MALQNAYLRFLAAPDPSALAENASLSYITTTITVAGAAEVVKHLTDLRKHLNKTKEDILSSIEGRDGLGIALETETSLEFTVSGGPYLPGLDDNFVTDRGVHLVVTHFVAFDRAGKIVQIRQSWDQASLLKQLDVIGRSGRNWPIRDSKDQIKLITKCVGGSAAATEAADLASRSRGSSTNAMRDPHATLNLFAPRAEEPEPESIISPYAGKTRPRQRSFTEILGDEPEDDDGSGVSGDSPSKSVIAPKGGAGKNFQPMRLFDGAAEAQGPDSPEQRAPDRFYRPNPKKQSEFGANVSRPPVPEDRKKAVKNMEANWSSYDKSPVSQKENSLPVARGVKKTDERGIVIGGDGMGGKKGTNRDWLYSEEAEETEETLQPRPVAGKKQGVPVKSGNFWDF